MAVSTVHWLFYASVIYTFCSGVPERATEREEGEEFTSTHTVPVHFGDTSCRRHGQVIQSFATRFTAITNTRKHKCMERPRQVVFKVQ